MTPTENATAQLAAFIAKFSRENQLLIKQVRQFMRRRFPTAFELVYDNYNFFVIGYSPTERPSDAILSIAAAANGVGVCLIHGARLKDPHKLLSGSGKQTRFIRVPTVDILARAEVLALLDAAVAQAGTPFAAGGKGTLVIRSISAKQRPRQ